MKRTKSLLVAMVMVFGLAMSALAADTSVDSLHVAQVFAGLDIVEYSGQLGFSRGGDYGSWVAASFTMALNGTITQLTVDGVVVVGDGDEPLVSIPVNAKGEARNFYFYLAALDGTGNTVAYGNFRKDLLLPGSPITVTLSPVSWPAQIVPFTPPAGVDASGLVLRSGGGASFYQKGVGFVISVDPTKSSVPYTIEDSTGVVLTSGTLDPFAGSQQGTDSSVNVMLEGGVRMVPDGVDGNVYLPKQVVDGESEGTPVKVYIWDTHGGPATAYAYATDGGAVQTSVYQLIGPGQMSLIATSDVNGGVTVGSEYGKVIVVVTGAAGGHFDAGFYLGMGGKG